MSLLLYNTMGVLRMRPFIKAENLVYEYSRRDEEGNIIEINKALNGVNIEVAAGDFIAVLGANGSGKSTFAKHLNALLVPTEGTLYVDGKDTSDHNNDLQIRQTAGMVFQNPDNQIISNVVEEDVGFGPENIGVPTEEIWRRVEESLKNVSMYEYRKQSPNHLSGGQKQRVAIAGIMAMKPSCIILDEPTAMLDPEGRKSVIKTVKELNKKEHITVILITHYMEEVTAADYVYVMGSGEVKMHGTPRQIFARSEELTEYKLTIPEVTKIALQLIKKGVEIPKNILYPQELTDILLKLKQKE